MDVSRRGDQTTIYIYHVDCEHDRTYTENVVEYLESQGVVCKSIVLNSDGMRPELQRCLDDSATAIIGFNSQLDHSWLPSGSFLEAAERHGVPVLQWIIDHPSFRWVEFDVSTSANSRFLLNSEYERQYFRKYCLPDALTATMGGVGPNRRSRIERLTLDAFMHRPVACLIPLTFSRMGRTIAVAMESINRLETSLADAVSDAVNRAQSDLNEPLDLHLTAALAMHDRKVPHKTFHTLYQLVEQSVQSFRRRRVFEVARKYPVLIQSDESAVPLMHDSIASIGIHVSMALTLARMPLCRAVLSVSPVNDMIHDRTMNALNGGCVAIVEDSVASKAIFEHDINALLFRYDDDSLEECLDVVCNQPERAYDIAQAGMRLREDPRVRFGEFRNIVDLARLRSPA